MILRNIIIDDMGDIINIDAASRHIRCNEHIDLARAELFHDPVTLGLAQVAMQTVCQIASRLQSSYEIIDAALRAAEDDDLSGILDIQHAAEALQLLARLVIDLVDERYGKIFPADAHGLRVLHIASGQLRNRCRHRCRKEQRLAFFRGKVGQDRLDILNEAHIQHFIGFIEHQRVHIPQLDCAAADMVEQASRCPGYDLHTIAQCPDLTVNRLAAVDRQRPHPLVAANLIELLRNLDCQFTGRSKHQRLNAMAGIDDLLNGRDAKGGRLARSGLCLADDIMALQYQRYGLRLNRRRLLKAHIMYGVQYLTAEFNIPKGLYFFFQNL